MEWGKVKSIFIVIFVVINVFLIFRLLSAYKNMFLSSEVLDSTTQILTQRGVKVIPKFPTKIDNIKLLYFASSKGSSKEVEVVKPINLGNEVLNEKDIQAMLKQVQIDEGSYVLDAINVFDVYTEYVLLQVMEKKYKVFNSMLKISVKDNKVTKIVKSSPDQIKLYSQDNNVIPIHEVILMNYRSLLEDFREVEVNEFSLGYIADVEQLTKTLNENSDSLDKQGMDRGFAVPCWRIKLSDGRNLYYHANTGDQLYR